MKTNLNNKKGWGFGPALFNLTGRSEKTQEIAGQVFETRMVWGPSQMRLHLPEHEHTAQNVWSYIRHRLSVTGIPDYSSVVISVRPQARADWFTIIITTTHL